MKTTRGIRATALATISIFLLAGCHKKHVAPPPAPLAPDTTENAGAPTANFTADPTAIDLGQSVVLNWRTTNATSVTIDGIGPVNPNGTQTVTPSNSTNFHLTAKGEGGTTEANVRVTVRVPQAPTDTSAQSDMGSDAEFHSNVKDIFFGYDSFDLNEEGKQAAQAAATYLNAHPNIRVVIGGYCDDRGSAEYNLALGENRANAAKTALVNDGVAASRVRVISYGKEKQFCTEENESCWQQNRRAQFNLDR